MSHNRNLARLSRHAGPVMQTVQALRDMPIYHGLFPPVAWAIGENAVADRPPDMYYWGPASTDPDDGRDVLLPTGHTGAGRWVRLPHPTITEASLDCGEW